MASDIAADAVRELGAALTERDRAVREAFIRTEDCHAAIARHAAAEAEVSALRAALEAAETDAQLCRERLGDERERRRAAEALAVPEGWHIEYGEICGYGGRCRHANRLHAHLLLDSDDDPPARLVPSPPPGDKENPS